MRDGSSTLNAARSMASRLKYTLPIARQLLLSMGRGLRPGGLAASLPHSAEGKAFIIVAGAGRSGTSAVARVLHESGVKMGDDFGASSESNPLGFYEEATVRDLNQRILTECGMGRMDRWPWRSTVLAIAEPYQEEMAELASKGAGGWKDPRFCITLEAWLQLLPRRPKLVVCLRSPEAFLRSVTRLYGLVRRDVVERWWAREQSRLLHIVRDYQLEATCVEYEYLVQHREEAVAALSEFVGHPLDAKYVEPDLRRFAYAVPSRYAALYEEVRALGPHGTSAARSNRGIAGLFAGGRKRGRLSEEGKRTIDGYLQRMRAIDSRVATAKATWSERVGASHPKLVFDHESGPGLFDVLAETRSASAAHLATLAEAQAELGSLLPPAAFERYHECTLAYVDRERLAAQLMLNAADGPRPEQQPLDDALRAWRHFSSPEAVAKGQERRSREYDRALKKSGYRPVRPETEGS